MIIFIINTTEYKQTVLSLRKTHPWRTVLKGHPFIGPSQAHMETRPGNIRCRTGGHYISIKGCNQGPKDACDYTDIAMDEVDKFLVYFSLNDLKLDI